MKLKSLILTMALLFAPIAVTSEAEAKTIKLPNASTQFEKYKDNSLLEALQNRKSTRVFSKEALSVNDISAILWSAYGINREDGKRTIPTSGNRQNMVLYTLDAQGMWRYDAVKHTLVRVSNKNLLAPMGNPPLLLLYVADTNNGGNAKQYGMHAGLMAQSAALYASIAGIGNVVIGGANTEDFIKSLNLPKGQELIYTHKFGR